ncbi:hypothetical protein DM860_003383 [Cuscuta australis]|uniref:Uncharacterized protein n=1 Tax=Cuscuta australis TaxID=267555 RepID=A0A328DGF8_9ASTE|nr:hypothetical protein DM860_003383 [Cuscuta australis]
MNSKLLAGYIEEYKNMQRILLGSCIVVLAELWRLYYQLFRVVLKPQTAKMTRSSEVGLVPLENLPMNLLALHMKCSSILKSCQYSMRLSGL